MMSAEMTAAGSPGASAGCAHRADYQRSDEVSETSNGRYVSKNLNVLHEKRLTYGQRTADGLARVAGSWAFILVFLGLLVTWVALNSALLIFRHFDPYPFILLNLVLSCLAAMQAPVIMMSQNRQAAKDRLHADLDYEVNLKVEREIAMLHEKVDQLLGA